MRHPLERHKRSSGCSHCWEQTLRRDAGQRRDGGRDRKVLKHLRADFPAGIHRSLGIDLNACAANRHGKEERLSQWIQLGKEWQCVICDRDDTARGYDWRSDSIGVSSSRKAGEIGVAGGVPTAKPVLTVFSLPVTAVE